MAEATNLSAIHRFNAGQKTDAQDLLNTLVTCDLAESDRVKAEDDLREIETRTAWDQAIEHLDYGEWQQAIVELEQVISLTNDIDVRQKACEYWRLAHQYNAQGLPGQRKRFPAAIAPAASPVPRVPAYASGPPANAGHRRWSGVWVWVAAAAAIGACAVLANVNSGADESAPQPTTPPRASSFPSARASTVVSAPSTPVRTAAPPTPRPVDRPTFYVNSAPVGCHASPDANVQPDVVHPPGTVQAMDAFIRQLDGTWHREVSRQCWIRTQPGPVLEFRTSAEAEQNAVLVRRRLFSAGVNSQLTALRSSRSTANSMPVVEYRQAAGNVMFAEAAERAAADAKRLGDAVRNATYGEQFSGCRDALLRRSQVEERFWADLAAAAQFSNAMRWNNAVDYQDTVSATARTADEQCSGVLTI